MNQFCAIDLEMNGQFPLAVALVKGYRDGGNLVITDSRVVAISQEGRKINHYVKKNIVTDESLWQGRDSCKNAVLALLDMTKNVEVVFTWGKESKLLSRLFAYADMAHDVRGKRLLAKLVNSQNMFETPVKLQSMFEQVGGRTKLYNWHNPLTDATATLELALMHYEK